jgi:hypothetical protein
MRNLVSAILVLLTDFDEKPVLRTPKSAGTFDVNAVVTIDHLVSEQRCIM